MTAWAGLAICAIWASTGFALVNSVDTSIVIGATIATIFVAYFGQKKESSNEDEGED
jgi:hypothetical protein